MKICAMTMVYRDYWALSQWYAHFGRHLGHENLFIVAHGPDPEIQRRCPLASIITIPREKFDNFDNSRSKMLNAFQNGLDEIYDWVIRTDADELICLDHSLYESFEDFFAQQEGKSAFSLGINLAEIEGDAPLPHDTPVLKLRRHALFSSHYSKAWAVRGRIGLHRHGVQVRPRFCEDYPFHIPRGVYLIHLKFANGLALALANKHRHAVANSEGKGLPGQSWRDPDVSIQRISKQLDNSKLLPWARAEDRAYEIISQEPIRDLKKGIVRVCDRPIRIQTTLPEWFQSA